MVEARLLRILLIIGVQCDKHAKAIKYLNFKLVSAQEVISQFQETIKVMVQKRDNLRVLLKPMALETQTHVAYTSKIKGYFNDSLSFVKRHEEELSTFKDDLVETFYTYFERVKEHASFLYQELDLSRWIYLRCLGEVT